MTVQEAMQKAVEGGYHIESADGVDITYSGANDEYSAWTRTDTESSFLVPVEETLLDPCFWQALGRKPRQNPIYKNGGVKATLLDRLTPYRSIPRFLWHESFILLLRRMVAHQNALQRVRSA